MQLSLSHWRPHGGVMCVVTCMQAPCKSTVACVGHLGRVFSATVAWPRCIRLHSQHTLCGSADSHELVWSVYHCLQCLAPAGPACQHAHATHFPTAPVCRPARYSDCHPRCWSAYSVYFRSRSFSQRYHWSANYGRRQHSTARGRYT